MATAAFRYIWLVILWGSTQEAVIKVGDYGYKEDEKFAMVRSLFKVPDDFLIGENKLVFFNAKERVREYVYLRSDEFVAQPCSDNDWDTLHARLEDYFQYLESNPNSFLPRYLSAFRIDTQRWIVMHNWVRPAIANAYHRTYELKGASCSSTRAERFVRVAIGEKDFAGVVLEDLNFVASEGRLHVPSRLYLEMLKDIEADVEFLRQRNRVDYSLVVSVSTVGMCDRHALTTICNGRHDRIFNGLYSSRFKTRGGYVVGVDEDDGLIYAYSLVLVNTLQLWREMPKVNPECNPKPTHYKARFVEFFRRRVEEGYVRSLVESECKIQHALPLSSLGSSGQGSGNVEGCYFEGEHVPAIVSDDTSVSVDRSEAPSSRVVPVAPEPLPEDAKWYNTRVLLQVVVTCLSALLILVCCLSVLYCQGDSQYQVDNSLELSSVSRTRNNSVHFGLDTSPVPAGSPRSNVAGDFGFGVGAGAGGPASFGGAGWHEQELTSPTRWRSQPPVSGPGWQPPSPAPSPGPPGWRPGSSGGAFAANREWR